jgi:leucyl aminopeptidase
MKMGALLGVAKGSHNRPRLIHLSYKPSKKPKRHIAIVGKGITFDSGGLSIKPSASMETMKMDMAGAAAVLGIFQVLKRFDLPWKVTGVIPAAENMPGGGAQRPGDIVRAMNGKTVEVINTDAEGRLILSDALCYAAKEKPDEIVDIATLTGACVVALGHNIAGILGNDQKFITQIIEAGKKAGEKLWQLPLEQDYKEGLKSDVADMKNVTGKGAGTITGALFLSEFVEVKHWAHIDIAGPGMGEKEQTYVPKGGTGFGIRTIVEYLRNRS